MANFYDNPNDDISVLGGRDVSFPVPSDTNVPSCDDDDLPGQQIAALLFVYPVLTKFRDANLAQMPPHAKHIMLRQMRAVLGLPPVASGPL